MQGAELAEAERLEQEARVHRDRAVGHGMCLPSFYPVVIILSVEQVHIPTIGPSVQDLVTRRWIDWLMDHQIVN